jgi:hypothetical protein
MKVTALVLAALLYWAAPVNGQQTQARQRAAEELVEAMQYERATALSTEQVFQHLAAMGAEGSNPHSLEVMRDFFREHVTWAKLKPEYVKVYVELFTAEELHQLAAFYRTPAGSKLARLRPELTERDMEIARRFIQPHLPQLLEKSRTPGQP